MEQTLKQKMNKDAEMIDLATFVHDFIRGIKKFWWILLILSFLGACCLFVNHRRSYVPLYQSKASLAVLTRNSSGTDYDYSFSYSGSTAERMVSIFPAILQSEILIDLIKDDLGVSVINASIVASSVENSNLFSISVVGTNVEDTKKILDSVIKNCPEAARYIIGDIQLILMEEPEYATMPVNNKNYIFSIIAGGVVGLILGCFFVFIYAVTRKTVRKETEIRELLGTVCLGMIPKTEKKKRLCIYNRRIGAVFQESIRSVAFRVQRQMGENNKRVLMVTSTILGEGVTSITNNLAYAMGEIGKKVVLLDLSDKTRKPKETYQKSTTADGIFFQNEPDELLISDESRHVWYVRELENDVKEKLLSSPEYLHKLINRILREADCIIIDAPTCSNMSKTGVVAECSDAVLYVIKQDCVNVYQIMECLSDVGCYDVELFGCVLNQVDLNGLSGYGGGRYGKYYGKYYNSSGASKRRKKENYSYKEEIKY